MVLDLVRVAVGDVEVNLVVVAALVLDADRLIWLNVVLVRVRDAVGDGVDDWVDVGAFVVDAACSVVVADRVVDVCRDRSRQMSTKVEILSI